MAVHKTQTVVYYLV